jgi:hypothetical protein
MMIGPTTISHITDFNHHILIYFRSTLALFCILVLTRLGSCCILKFIIFIEKQVSYDLFSICIYACFFSMLFLFLLSFRCRSWVCRLGRYNFFGFRFFLILLCFNRFCSFIRRVRVCLLLLLFLFSLLFFLKIFALLCCQAIRDFLFLLVRASSCWGIL